MYGYLRYLKYTLLSDLIIVYVAVVLACSIYDYLT